MFLLVQEGFPCNPRRVNRFLGVFDRHSVGFDGFRVRCISGDLSLKYLLIFVEWFVKQLSSNCLSGSDETIDIHE